MSPLITSTPMTVEYIRAQSMIFMVALEMLASPSMQLVRDMSLSDSLCLMQGEEGSLSYYECTKSLKPSLANYNTCGCIIMHVFTGAGIYITSSGESLPNNSFIAAQVRDTIPIFRCLSGSSIPHVGQIINNWGQDITFSASDPFSIRREGASDPGTLFVRSLRRLRWGEQGIYTYRTPDENGNMIVFHFGLYLSNSLSKKS